MFIGASLSSNAVSGWSTGSRTDTRQTANISTTTVNRSKPIRCGAPIRNEEKLLLAASSVNETMIRRVYGSADGLGWGY
jgi:hypothetical protein